MRRTKNPRVSTVKIGSRKYYRLTFWTGDGRHREHFSHKAEADSRQAEVEQERKKLGEQVVDIPPRLRADAVMAAEILRGTGYTLVEAARAMVKAVEKDSAGLGVRDAVDLFIRTRDKQSDNYRSLLGARMEQFTKFFEGRKTTAITAEDCQRFLDGIAGRASVGTVTHYRTAVSMFFHWCHARGYSANNPAKLTAKPKKEQTPAEILTPDQVRRILEACDAEILPGVVLQVFCGIRAAEIARLDWLAIRRHERTVKDKVDKEISYTITVGAAAAKTSSRRVVDIPEAAVDWLGLNEPTSDKDKLRVGLIWPKKERARDLWTLARVRAGFGPFFTDYKPAKEAQAAAGAMMPWPDNALRHSAISYHLALTGDLARVTYQAGNSPKVAMAHYNGLATPQDAEEFYEIRRKG